MVYAPQDDKIQANGYPERAGFREKRPEQCRVVQPLAVFEGVNCGTPCNVT